MARYEITQVWKETAVVDVGDLPPGMAEEILVAVADPDSEDTAYGMADLNPEITITSWEVKLL